MTRTGEEAINYARSRIGANSMSESGMCLKFTRECFAVPSYYASAVDAGYGCNAKHGGDWNPPPATPVWFRSPSVYDHVAFYVSEHEVISRLLAGSPGTMMTPFSPPLRSPSRVSSNSLPLSFSDCALWHL